MNVDRHEEHAELMDRSNSIGIDFLCTDIQAALTFIQVAETSGSMETRVRNYGKALEGYRTVLHFLPRVSPSPEELASMQDKLEQIRVKLAKAGYLDQLDNY